MSSEPPAKGSAAEPPSPDAIHSSASVNLPAIVTARVRRTLAGYAADG
jgi:hypothetical protein